MMQPYLDHILSDEEMREAEMHLDECDWCRRRYKFEESLRVYVRQAVGQRTDALRRSQAEARRSHPAELGGFEVERSSSSGAMVVARQGRREPR